MITAKDLIKWAETLESKSPVYILATVVNDNKVDTVEIDFYDRIPFIYLNEDYVLVKCEKVQK